MELTQLSYSTTMISFKKCLKSAQEARAQIDSTVTVEVIHNLHPLFSNYYANRYSSELPEKHSSSNGQGSFFFFYRA